jgi:hypothetical protein
VDVDRRRGRDDVQLLTRARLDLGNGSIDESRRQPVVDVRPFPGALLEKSLERWRVS